jgi:hypothetical protein
MNLTDKMCSLEIASVEVFSQATPIVERVNEDRWLIVESQSFPHLMTFAVIDGAGERIKLPSIVNQLAIENSGLTASA